MRPAMSSPVVRAALGVVALLALALPADAARRSTESSATRVPARNQVDYAQEAEAIRACASSTALPESVTMVAGAGEGGRITVTRAVACFMKVVQAMADEDEDAEEETAEIPLPKVDLEALELIVRFASGKAQAAGQDLADLKFSVVPRPLPGPLAEQETVLSDDAALMDEVAQDLSKLFRLTNAANFVDCPGLLELCTARIAQMFIGKTPQQIREVIPNALTSRREVEG